MSRRLKFHLLIAAWIGVLLFMVAGKHHHMYTGKRILLDVVPVDPRHPFMGAYVVLNFSVSTIETNNEVEYVKGGDIYVTLEERNGVWEAVSASRERPPEGVLFIRGATFYRPWSQTDTTYHLEDFRDVQPEGWIDAHEKELERFLTVNLNRFHAKQGDTIYILPTAKPKGNWDSISVFHKDIYQAHRSLDTMKRRDKNNEPVIISARILAVDRVTKRHLNVKYGIEKYFATEEKAKEYEMIRSEKRLMVEVYVSPDGKPALGELIIKPKEEDG